MKNTLYAIAILILALSLGSCRTDKPPIISIICIGDGLGGADCTLPDGTRVYKAPSELKNFWMTTQTDEANFAGWCYKVPARTAGRELDKIRGHIMATREGAADAQ